MSAIASTADGNWSATATWTGGIVPGNGDTCTITNNVTVDVDTTIGSSPSTGGTPAIAFGAGVQDKTLTVAAGVTLTVKGDLAQSANNAQRNTVQVDAGGSIVFLPASGQRYDWTFSQICVLNFAGSSGSRCSLSTDLSSGGDPARMVHDAGSNRMQGVYAASYCDFTDLGDSTHYGVVTAVGYDVIYPSWEPISIAHCAFTRTSFHSLDLQGTWDGDFTFADNTFTDSVKVTFNVAACALVMFTVVASAGTRQLLRNGFDASVEVGKFDGATFGHNVVRGVLYAGGIPGPYTFDGNLIYGDTALIGGGDGAVMLQVVGDVADSYFGSTHASNPSYISDDSDGPIAVSGCVFENVNGSNVGDGDVFDGCPIKAAPATVSWTGNLHLPSSNGKMAGNFSFMGTSPTDANCSIVFEHNTVYAGNTQFAAMVGETHAPVAGQFTSYKSNLFWFDGTPNDYCRKFGDFNGATSGGTSDIFDPSDGDYNAGFGIRTEDPSTYTGNTYPQAGNGYQANFSATPGAHDVNGVDPGFVDPTRNLGTWWVSKGHTTTGTNAGDASAAVDYAATDPGTLIPDLVAWVRAGFAPTDSAYHNTAHDGTDIGAVAYSAPGGGGGGGAFSPIGCTFIRGA